MVIHLWQTTPMTEKKENQSLSHISCGISKIQLLSKSVKGWKK